jgi:hypothetical protein
MEGMQADAEASSGPTGSETAQTKPAHDSGGQVARSQFGRVTWLVGIAASIILLAVVAAFVRSRYAAPSGKLMFVVLPFENLTGHPSQEYIADGMTEEMITQMGYSTPGTSASSRGPRRCNLRGPRKAQLRSRMSLG